MSDLNYFLISCSWEYYEKVVEGVERTIGSSPAVWTAHPSTVKKLTRKFPKTKVMNTHDLSCADLSVVEENIYPSPLSFEPLSSDWQKDYSFERGMVMDNLLHRSDFGGRYEHSELLDIVNDYFIAGYSLIKHYRPQLIYFEVPPHTMYDLAIYYIAIRNGIKTLMVYHSCIPAVSVFFSKFNDPNGIYLLPPEQQTRYNEKEQLFSEYCENIKNLSPFYMHTDLQTGALFRLIRFLKLSLSVLKSFLRKSLIEIIEKLSVKSEKIISRTSYSKKRGYLLKQANAGGFDKVRHYLINWRLELYYRKISSQINFCELIENSNFVYIPLSLQMEMSTMPSAGRMFDQKTYIRMISAALPDGWLAVVKENPYQFNHNTGVPARDRRFYKELVEMGVLVAPLSHSSAELITKSKAVVVTTGTAGFEAIVGYGKPVISFAYTWYFLPGIRVISSMNQLRKAFQDLENCEWQVCNESVKRQLGVLSASCVYLWGEGPTIKEQNWDLEAIISNISSAITARILEK